MSAKASSQTETTGSGVRFLEIDSNHAGQRLDNYLVKILKGVPKTRIYRLIRKGEVRINKKRCKPDYRLQTEDMLRIPPVRVAEREKVEASTALKQRINESILYQDDDLLIINKLTGMSVHGGTGVKIGLIEALRESQKSPTLELVHRLDKETSGCLIIARHNEAVKLLSDLFRSGEVDKCYHALVQGKWPSSLKLIDAPLLRQEPRGGERKVKVSDQGKSAKTMFNLLDSFREASLIEATLLTGRTHQIRVHCQQAGYPLIGDNKYADKEDLRKYSNLGIKHMCLHAKSVSFKHPLSNELITVEAPLSEVFTTALDKLKSLSVG